MSGLKASPEIIRFGVLKARPSKSRAGAKICLCQPTFEELLKATQNGGKKNYNFNELGLVPCGATLFSWAGGKKTSASPRTRNTLRLQVEKPQAARQERAATPKNESTNP